MKRGVFHACITVGSIAVMGTAVATEMVELDLDGVLGNGPDTLAVAAGDFVPVNVWFVGDGSLLAFDMYICNPEGAMVFLELAYLTPGTWTNEDPEEAPGGCVKFFSLDMGFDGMGQPAGVATATYWAAADNAIAEVAVGDGTEFLALLPGGGIASGAIDGSVSAFVRIGDPGSPTGTRETTWSSVKGLFR